MVTVWLARKKIPIGFTAIPMVFMVAMTGWAMTINLNHFLAAGNRLLFSIGSIIMLLEAWMVIEGVIVLVRMKRDG